MAILLFGATECSLCGEIIEEHHKVRMFSAFLPENHRLFRYSDASFHLACIEKCADYAELERLENGFWEVYDLRPLPTESEAKNFDAWYNNSKEIKEWRKKMEAYWAENP